MTREQAEREAREQARRESFWWALLREPLSEQAQKQAEREAKERATWTLHQRETVRLLRLVAWFTGAPLALGALAALLWLIVYAQ